MFPLIRSQIPNDVFTLKRSHVHDGVLSCFLVHNNMCFPFIPSLGLLELLKLLLLRYVSCNLSKVIQTQGLDPDPMGTLRLTPKINAFKVIYDPK